MNNTSNFTVAIAQWPEDIDALRSVRETVFVKEQKVPQELEWDGLDKEAIHVLAKDNVGHPIGTARLQSSGKIGRMAVLKSWRGKGVGQALLTALLDDAIQADMVGLYLNAQKDAIPFYEKQGFRATGPEFYEANIPHKKMELSCD